MSHLPSKYKKYRKLLVFASGVAVFAADKYLGPDNGLTAAIITLATGYGVWRAPNKVG